MNRKNDPKKVTSTTYIGNHTKRPNRIDTIDRFYWVLSVGTIVSGILTCLASVGVGIGLMMVGSVILAEL
jgi:hypothetical protein